MFEIVEIDQKIMVTPEKNIVAEIVSEFRESMKKYASDEKEIVVDLKNVEMIDSMGLGALIATHNSMQKYEKKLEIENISKDLLALMKTMCLDQHFVINI